MLTHAVSIDTFLEVLINESFEFDLNLDTRVRLLQLLHPFLQIHYLVEALNVLSEFLERGAHQPLYPVSPEAFHNNHNDRYPDYNNYQVPAPHLIELDQQGVDRDPAIDT